MSHLVLRYVLLYSVPQVKAELEYIRQYHEGLKINEILEEIELTFQRS